MWANWDEKYLTQVGHFSRLNAGWKVSGEISHLSEWDVSLKPEAYSEPCQTSKMEYFAQTSKMENLRK